MTTQKAHAAQFATLHVPGTPLILFNIWDAGSAKAVAESGATAIATGSWSVAAANGYTDGETLPLELVLANAQRIVRAVHLPVSIDFESGYGFDPDAIESSFAKLIETGAIGANLEDQIQGTDQLFSIDAQCARIRAARRAANRADVAFFINARTDIFLKRAPENHNSVELKDALEEAMERARAYAEAGASGFFVPGLRDATMIEQICAHSPMPVNIMAALSLSPSTSTTPSTNVLAQCGVARISYGPGPYRQMMAALMAAGKQVLG